ncbi:hypothetical protein GALL_391240 [mine drainage metagenome]|uniref:Uncharacterized protein n=1 Tax=mine drainage metagenome TaxID=410659 RepID=A0A1J5Q657_9ZZZZ
MQRCSVLALIPGKLRQKKPGERSVQSSGMTVFKLKVLVACMANAAWVEMMSVAVSRNATPDTKE